LGVRVFSPSGRPLGSMGGVGNTTNVAFGGDDAKTLFITGQTALYQIKLNVPGLPN
jgi:gluconolactonase